MVSIEWDKGKLNNLYSKLDKLCTNIKKSAESGLNEATKQTQKYALNKKVGNKEKDKILYEIINDKNTIIGRVYTNFKYAPFLEYGTGKFAELPHIGTTKTFVKSGYTYWYLPVEKAERDLPNPTIWVNDQEFYIMFSQEPRPFMRPTAFERKNPNIKLIKQSISDSIKEVIK